MSEWLVGLSAGGSPQATARSASESRGTEPPAVATPPAIGCSIATPFPFPSPCSPPSPLARTRKESGPKPTTKATGGKGGSLNACSLAGSQHCYLSVRMVVGSKRPVVVAPASLWREPSAESRDSAVHTFLLHSGQVRNFL